jgi:hypothetical protein
MNDGIHPGKRGVERRGVTDVSPGQLGIDAGQVRLITRRVVVEHAD